MRLMCFVTERFCGFYFIFNIKKKCFTVLNPFFIYNITKRGRTIKKNLLKFQTCSINFKPNNMEHKV